MPANLSRFFPPLPSHGNYPIPFVEPLSSRAVSSRFLSSRSIPRTEKESARGREEEISISRKSERAIRRQASPIRSPGYSLSGVRGTWIRFVLVQIGTRRLGTRSGLACQVARVPRIRDAPGFSHRIPGSCARVHAARARERAPDELLRRFRKAPGSGERAEPRRDASSARSRARMDPHESSAASTKMPRLFRAEIPSTKATLCSNVRTGYFAAGHAEFRCKFRQANFPGNSLRLVIFYPPE